jgi:hypothetical protein
MYRAPINLVNEEGNRINNKTLSLTDICFIGFEIYPQIYLQLLTLDFKMLKKCSENYCRPFQIVALT